MKTLSITSVEALDVTVAEAIRLKIEHTKATAFKDAELAIIEKTHQPRITALAGQIEEIETDILEYCRANRITLFHEKKSRETSLAEFGFEFTPYRVEPASEKTTLKKIITRLKRLPWGKAYLTKPEPALSKAALLKDRSQLTPEQCAAAGISFQRDEQFFIRPKPQTAQPTVMEAA